MAWIARVDKILVTDSYNLGVYVTYYDDTVPVGQDGLPVPQVTVMLPFATNVSAAQATAKIIEVGLDALKCYQKTASLQNKVGTTIPVA